MRCQSYGKSAKRSTTQPSLLKSWTLCPRIPLSAQHLAVMSRRFGWQAACTSTSVAPLPPEPPAGHPLELAACHVMNTEEKRLEQTTWRKVHLNRLGTLLSER